MITNIFEVLQAYIKAEDFAYRKQLLDDWSSEILQRDDYSFDRGVLGLGWLINYLIHEKYMEGDADEILEDIDDNIYKLVIREILDDNLDIMLLLGYVTYYQQRLTYRSNIHFYRRFTHLECLKLLLKKLNFFLLDAPLHSREVITQKIDIVLKYSFLIKTCINEKLVEEAFYFAMEQLLEYFENNYYSVDDILWTTVTIKQYGHPYWLNCINACIYPNEGLSQEQALLKRYTTAYLDIQSYIKDTNPAFTFKLLTNVGLSKI